MEQNNSVINLIYYSLWLSEKIKIFISNKIINIQNDVPDILNQSPEKKECIQFKDTPSSGLNSEKEIF